jgi:8-oxo-dGTP diphosphatase
MRQWLVAGGLIERDGAILLVKNLRRDGRLDWSPPGGVVEIGDGETVLDGLPREVREETGITVTEWTGPIYEVRAVAEGLGWTLRAEIHQAVSFSGDIVLEDPDGIVVDACFVPVDACSEHLGACVRWVQEPLRAWLDERWETARRYSYQVHGDAPAALEVVRES